MAYAKRFLAVWLTCFLVLVVRVVAADQPEKLKSVQFSVYSLAEIEKLFFVPSPGQKAISLRFLSAYRSPTYSYRGPRQIRFFSSNVDPEHSLPVAIWEIPDETRKVVLLFQPSSSRASDALPFDVTAVEDSLDKIPLGHFAIYNVWGVEFEGKYGSRKIRVKGGLNEPLKGTQHGLLKLFSETEGQKLQVAGYGFEVLAEDRVMILIFPPTKNSSLAPLIRKLTDTVPAVERENRATKK